MLFYNLATFWQLLSKASVFYISIQVRGKANEKERMPEWGEIKSPKTSKDKCHVTVRNIEASLLLKSVFRSCRKDMSIYAQETRTTGPEQIFQINYYLMS